MALSWDEVSASEGYKSLSHAEKASAANQYFKQVVAPKVSANDMPEVSAQFSKYTGMSIGGIVAPEPAPKEDAGIIGRIEDAGVDLAKGAVGLGQSVVGLASMATGGLVGEGMRALGYDPESTNDFLGSLYTEARQSEEAQVQGAHGFTGTAKSLLTNPAVLAGKVLETAPLMLSNIAAARMFAAKAGLAAEEAAIAKGATEEVAKKLATAAASTAGTAAAAAVEGAQQAGSSFDGLAQQGVDLGRNYVASIGSGITTAGIALAGGKLGKQIGLGDVEAGIVGKGGLIARTAKGAVQEGVLEEAPQSATEQGFQNFALQNPLTQGMPEAVATGLVIGSAAGGGMAAVQGRSDAPAPVDPVVEQANQPTEPIQNIADSLAETLQEKEDVAKVKEIVQNGKNAKLAKLQEYEAQRQAQAVNLPTGDLGFTEQPANEASVLLSEQAGQSAQEADAAAIAQFEAGAAIPADSPYLSGDISDDDLAILADNGVQEAGNALMIRKQAANSSEQNQNEVVANAYGAAEVQPGKAEEDPIDTIITQNPTKAPENDTIETRLASNQKTPVESQDSSNIAKTHSTLHPDMREMLSNTSEGLTENDLRHDVYSLTQKDNGLPVTIQGYHGEGRDTKESIYADGIDDPALGKGKYIAIDRNTANKFGRDVTKESIHLSNPFIITSDKELQDIMGMNSIPHDNESRKPALKRAREKIEALGHDGVIINVPFHADENDSGDSIKRLREIFSDTQVIQFNKKTVTDSGQDKQSSDPAGRNDLPTTADQGSVEPSKRTYEDMPEEQLQRMADMGVQVAIDEVKARKNTTSEPDTTPSDITETTPQPDTTDAVPVLGTEKTTSYDTDSEGYALTASGKRRSWTGVKVSERDTFDKVEIDGKSYAKLKVEDQETAPIGDIAKQNTVTFTDIHNTYNRDELQKLYDSIGKKDYELAKALDEKIASVDKLTSKGFDPRPIKVGEAQEFTVTSTKAHVLAARLADKTGVDHKAFLVGDGYAQVHKKLDKPITSKTDGSAQETADIAEKQAVREEKAAKGEESSDPYKNAPQRIQERRAKIDARNKVRDDFIQANADRPFSVSSGNLTATVTKSSKEPGRWQATILQKDGSPSGDYQRDTFAEAVQSLHEDGFDIGKAKVRGEPQADHIVEVNKEVVRDKTNDKTNVTQQEESAQAIDIKEEDLTKAFVTPQSRDMSQSSNHGGVKGTVEESSTTPILNDNSKPFKNKDTATMYMRSNKLTNHEVVPVDGGFGVQEMLDGSIVTDKADVQEIKNSYSQDDHKTLFKRVFNGDAVSADDFKKSFDMIIKHKDKIITELNSMTKKAILERNGGMFAERNRNENKADVVESAYHDMLTDFTLGQSFSYTFGEDSNAGIKRVVDETTDASLNKFAADRKGAREERAKQSEERKAGMEEPQTIEDYHNILRQKKVVDGMTYAEARLSLTLAQREAYDSLTAEESRTERSKRKASQQEATFSDGDSYESTDIIQTKHTKLGHDLWQFQLVDRINDRAIFKTLVAKAKQLGGNYSSYRGNGAIAGWQFRTEEAAQAFKGLISGKSESAKDVMKKRRDAYADDKSQSATERLEEMADSLESRANDKLNHDRKTNTSRRASMAAHAEADAESDISLAKTMRNIATAIREGKAKFLDRVRQKVQVEELRGYVNLAHGRLIRDKYDSYNEQENHKHDPVTVETADYTDYPSYIMYRSDLATLARKMMETAGSKQDGAKLLKVADDVSKEYIKFARENMHKVSRYARADGTNAVFTSKPMADKSLQRSGFKGKAIVLPFKRGQNIIIMSPSEAIKEGIWEGDNDKRITLREGFGDDIVSKLGKDAPWQFKHVSEQLRRLKGMGIETPAEHRAALREFINLSVPQKQADKVKVKEREMIGRKNDGLDFFPTPESAADEMVSTADIQEGMRVLEPSAGWGHIADKIKEAGVTPDVIELSGERRELLELKGYDPVASDFMEFNEGGYDRIIMNPPFSDRRDMEHIQHAYGLLKPGGRLVAITGEGVFFGKDKKAVAFREWLEEVGATDEKMDDGTFKDSNLPVNTGANARMVVIDKPKGTALYSKGGLDSAVSGEQLSSEKLGNIVSRITGNSVNFPDFVIAHDITDTQIPDDLREEITYEESAGNPEDKVNAVFHTDGKIYLINSRIKNKEQAESAIYHELHGHYGVRGMMDAGADFGEYVKAMNSIHTIIGGDVGIMQIAKANSINLDQYFSSLNADERLNEENRNRIILEELVSHIAQKPTLQRMLHRALVAFAKGLRSMGLHHLAEKIQQSDTIEAELVVMKLVSGGRSYVKKGKTGSVGKDTGSVFQRSYTPEQEADSIESGNLGGIPEETRIEKWQRVFQDGFNRVKVVQNHLGNVNEGNDVYAAEERSSGKIAARLDDLDKGHLKPLLQSMRENGVSLEQMDSFLMARHAKERNDYIASIRPDMQDSGSGISTAEAEKTLASFSKSETKALKALAKQVYAVNRLHVESMLKGHLISQETADLWTNQYQYYVPLKGKEGSDNGRSLGTGYQIKNSGIQQSLGRGDGNVAESPLTHVFAQAESAIVRAEKNKVGQYLLKLVLDNPDSDLWSYTKASYDKFMTLSGDMAEGFAEPQASMVEGRDYHAVKGINPKDAAEYRAARNRGEKPAKPKQSVYYAIDPQYNNRDDVFTTMVGGEKYSIQIKDNLMMEQMKKLNASKMSEVVMHAGTLNRYLAMVNTALNPEFVITNLERDLTTAGINMGGEHGKKMAYDMAKSLPSAMKGIHNALFGDGKHPMAKVFQEMKHAGGAIGFFGLEDTEVKIKKINARLHDSDAGAWASSKRNVAKLRDTILDANQVVENASRLAAYKVALDNGFTKNQAASIAKNLTVNFNRKGEAGAAINAGYLFFNASIQGTARIFTALKHPAVRKIVGAAAASAFALAAYNMSAGGDDDDGISRWEKVPDYIKQTNIVIMNSDGTYKKYKLPYGYNMFWYAGIAMHDLMYGKTTTAIKTGMNLATTALNAFNPLAGSDFLDTITPTALKPVEQSMRNKNFMGSNILPEQKYARYDVPDSEKAWAGTNTYLKALSRMLNEGTGGDEFHSGAVDISPETIKHYIGWVTGGAGMTAYRTADTATRLVAGDNIERKNIPLVRTFGGDIGTRFDTDRYYNIIGELNATNKQYDSLRHQDRRAAQAFRSDHLNELHLYKRIYRVNKRIKRLREYKRLATTMKKTSEVNRLNNEIAKVMRQFTTQYTK